MVSTKRILRKFPLGGAWPPRRGSAADRIPLPARGQSKPPGVTACVSLLRTVLSPSSVPGPECPHPSPFARVGRNPKGRNNGPSPDTDFSPFHFSFAGRGLAEPCFVSLLFSLLQSHTRHEPQTRKQLWGEGDSFRTEVIRKMLFLSDQQCRRCFQNHVGCTA